MSFFTAFTGQAQQGELKKGKEQADSYLNNAYSQGQGALTSGYGQAQNYLSPYAQQGAGANKLYGDAIGANGRDAQSGFQQGFQMDPGWQAQFQAGMKGLDQSATARGGLYSGNAMRGVAQYGQQFQRQAYNDRLQHLSALGQQGFGASSQQAQLAAGQGNAMAGLHSGYGQQQASNSINYANAQAQAQGVGVQNALGLAGLGVAAFMPGAGGLSAAGNMMNMANKGYQGAQGMANSAYNYFNPQQGGGMSGSHGYMP